MSRSSSKKQETGLPGRLETMHHALVLLLLSFAFWFCLRPLWIWLTAPAAVIGRTQIVGFAGASAAVFASYLHLCAWWRGCWRSVSVSELRLAVYLFVGHWLGYLLFFQPFESRALWGTWTVAAAAFTVLMALRFVLVRRIPPRALRAADLAAFYLCVLWAGGEVTLRTAAWIQPSVLLTHPDEGAIMNLEAMKRPPGHLRYGFPVNSRSFYDHEPADDREGPLVVTVGDSFSQGVVPHYYHYTTVAERALERELPGVEVYNVGVAGIDLREYYHLLLADVLPLDPDLVVISVFVGNDLTFQLPPPDPTPLGQWYSADRALVFQVPKRLAALAEAAAEGQLLGAGLDGASDAGPVEQTPEALAAAFPWVADPLLESETFGRETYLRIETERAHKLSIQSTHGFHARFELLRKIVDACGDTPVLFLIIPDEFQVDDELWQQIVERSDRELQRHRGTDLLRSWLQAEELPYVDLLPELRAAEPLDDGRLHVYRLRDTHFNVRGNRIAGEAMARGVRLLQM